VTFDRQQPPKEAVCK